ncbi:MAG: S46 family peptidase [Vicingaceae bacterium]
MFKKFLLSAILISFLLPALHAGEGMWLPMLLKKLNYDEMKEMGLQLTPEQLYSINNSSIKDAVVSLGSAERNFCTGEIISSKGLFLTNHHCGYGAIQSLSTTENNYLEDGYWAMSLEEEKPAGFSINILQRMDDITSIVLDGIDYKTSEEERASLVASRMDSLKKVAEEDSTITAVVKEFFSGNEYYIFHYKVYPDVRFVGAPPSSVGKYGGDTDNWMWPRHTGDFSMFRIYVDKNNNPAPYSEENVPYTPKHYLPISLKGVEKEDFAMIFGFPGSTDRFLTSYGVKLATDMDQPARVKIRRKKLDLYEEGMNKDQSIRLAYSAKHSQVSNYWKYFMGQTAGLKRLKVYEKKKSQEEAFGTWVSSDAGRKEIYGNVLSDIETAYAEMSKYALLGTYLSESIYGVEILRFSRSFSPLESVLEAKEVNNDQLSGMVAALRIQSAEHFKDYNSEIDRNVLEAMLSMYHEDLPESQQPAYFVELVHKNKHDFGKIADAIFKKSIFVSNEKVNGFLDKPSLKGLKADPAYKVISEIRAYYMEKVVPQIRPAANKLDVATRLYIDGLRNQNKDKNYYPNANSTMRVTYGKVLDYYPKDAVYYNYVTTLEGVMEKEDPSNREFIVSPKLKALYTAKDYGRYGKDGKLVVNFISNNDITGGNSGSPVINANGELIGTAFDGNWEAMSGDIAFEHELQRTISVDIRYTLFIIDKYAGAGYLIEEMKIIE